jgi:acetolactate decarboxylase
MHSKRLYFCLFLTLVALRSSAQRNTLYQFGVADGFVGGLYRGVLPVTQLKANGDFGLGAPGMLDGELTIYKGKVFQTKASGQTIEAPDSVRTPFAFVTFFKADTVFRIDKASGQKEVFQQLESILKKNGMYAIRITGVFRHLKTRAFPPVGGEPAAAAGQAALASQPSFPPLATLLDRQHFFEFNDTKGVLIGYKMPAYLAGINIEGYHFHFLSDQLTAGGHVLDFSVETAEIEVAFLSGFKLETPQDKAFMEYDFKRANAPALQQVEKGK